MEASSVIREMHVYECLWTTQLTQKRKKWNDGVVKFHLFNRRVALYDEDGNFVSALFHNKSSLEIGDELKFDRVLATVEADVGIEKIEVRSSQPARPVRPAGKTAFRKEVPNSRIPLSQIISESAKKKKGIPTSSKFAGVSQQAGSPTASKVSETGHKLKRNPIVNTVYGSSGSHARALSASYRPEITTMRSDNSNDSHQPNRLHAAEINLPRNGPSQVPSRMIYQSNTGQRAMKTESSANLEMELSQVLDDLEEQNQNADASSPILEGIEASDLYSSDEEDPILDVIKSTQIAAFDSGAEYGPWSKEAYDLFDVHEL